MPAAQAAAKALLNPGDHALALIDHQSQMAFAVRSIDAIPLRDNAGLVACAAEDRMVQAGVRPMTSPQYLLELQPDWARGETYGATTGIAKVCGGGDGQGSSYAGTMFGAREGH